MRAAVARSLLSTTSRSVRILFSAARKAPESQQHGMPAH
jgi:hypothetical protein